jgi:hypothetical protein
VGDATLGFQINTAPVKQAVADLDKLVPSANAAQAALDRLNKSGAPAVAAISQIGMAAGPARSATEAMVSAAVAAADTYKAKFAPALDSVSSVLARAVADANVYNTALKNGTTVSKALADAHGGLSTQAMAAQHSIRSAVEQFTLGVPPSMILTQQLNHLAFAASGQGGISGAFKEAGAAMLGLLNPTTLVIGGIVAAGAATYGANAYWKETEKQFDDVARAAGTTIQQLHALQEAASSKGIESSDFLTSSGKFASDLYDAKNNMGGLAALLVANGKYATDFAGTLGSVADIISRASTAQQKMQLLQQAGLPATMDWVKFMSQGGDAVHKAADEANSLNPQLQSMVDKARDFDDSWDRAWKNFKNDAYWAITGAKSLLNDVGTWANHLGQDLHPQMLSLRLQNAFSDTNAASTRTPAMQSGLERLGQQRLGQQPVVDPNAARQALQLQSQYISMLGSTASVKQTIAALDIQIKQYEMQPGTIALTQQQIDVLHRLTYEQTLGITALKQQTDSYNIQYATIGMSLEQATKYTAVQNALNDARRSGRMLTAQNIADITREAEATAEAAKRADDLKFAYDSYSGVLTDFASSLRQGQSAWDAFGTAAQNALGKIEDRLIKMATDQLWSAAFPSGATSGIGSLFSGLLSGGSSTAANGATILPSSAFVGPLQAGVNHTGYGPGDSFPTRLIHPAYYENAPRFHTGIGPNERAAIIRNDESVLTPGQMRALAPASRGGNAAPVEVHVHADQGTTVQKTTQSRTQSGGMRMDVWLKRQIDDTTAAAISNGQTATTSALERRYGLVPKL